MITSVANAAIMYIEFEEFPLLEKEPEIATGNESGFFFFSHFWWMSNTTKIKECYLLFFLQASCWNIKIKYSDLETAI